MLPPPPPALSPFISGRIQERRGEERSEEETVVSHFTQTHSQRERGREGSSNPSGGAYLSGRLVRLKQIWFPLYTASIVDVLAAIIHGKILKKIVIKYKKSQP
jgi:hypothetical protein